MEDRDRLRKIHDFRMAAHWGKRYDTTNDAWPANDAEWRQAPHGAKWDSNVSMAQWHLDFAKKLIAEGLV